MVHYCNYGYLFATQRSNRISHESWFILSSTGSGIPPHLRESKDGFDWGIARGDTMKPHDGRLMINIETGSDKLCGECLLPSRQKVVVEEI